MIFYIINLMLLTMFMVIARKKKRQVIIAFMWLTIVSAIRDASIGEDNTNYMTYFGWYKNISWRDALMQQENGYWFINKIVNSFGGTFQVLLAVCSILSLAGVCWFIYKYSYYPVLSVWLFITFGCYQVTMTRLRQAIAINITLVAVSYAQKRQLLKFILYIILATCFHTTAIFAIIIYPFINKRITQKQIGIISTTLAMLFLLRKPIMNMILRVASYTRYFHYASEYSGGGESQLLLYIVIFLFISMVAYYKRNKDSATDYSLMFNLSFFSCSLQMGALVIGIFNRMTEYFSVPLILLLPNTIQIFKGRQRQIVKVAFLSLSLLYYMYMFATSSSSTTHYMPFWG